MAELKTLLLLRHAKSSWDDPGLADHDRPLAPRGRKASKLIGAHLRSEQIGVSLVLCSSARRARQTLDLVAPSGEVSIEPDLYEASARQLLERLRTVPEQADAVMLIGHNPAIQELAVGLGEPASAAGGRKFPTGALARLTFDGRWEKRAPGPGERVAFVKPRE